MKRLVFRKIGEWKENNERGFYVEAVAIPKGRPRYMQIDRACLDADSPLKPEAAGEGLISFLVDEEDLMSRVN